MNYTLNNKMNILNKAFNALKNILTSKQAKRFYWTSFAGFLGILSAGIVDLDWKYIPLIMAVIAGLTKEINNRYEN